MKRLYQLLAAAMIGVTATPNLVSAQSPDEVRFYAPVTRSDTWYSGQNYVPQRGFYTFTTDASSSIQSVSAINQWLEFHGGAYVDGYYYFQSGALTSGINQLLFHKMDVETWTVSPTDVTVHSDDINRAYSFAYDYIGGKMYASCPNHNNTETPYMLRNVPLDGSNLSNIAPLEVEFPAIAFDNKGQLWGISRTALYKIDKETAKATKVGDMGVKQRSEEAAATFDFRTGKLYWYAQTVKYNLDMTEEWQYGLFEIDTTTGKATKVKDFGDTQEKMPDIFIIDNHPAAPATGVLTFTFAANSFDNGTVTYTAPATTYDGTPTSGNLSLEFFVDGNPLGAKTTVTPGSSKDIESGKLTKGEHIFTAYATDTNGRKSLAAQTTVYAGSDKPSAVTNIKVVTNDDQTSAIVTWDAPTKGVNGGNIEASQLTYRVLVNIGRETLYTDLKGTRFEHTPTYNMALTQYQIVPVINGIEGNAAYSNPALLGTAINITPDSPYLEAFNNVNSFSYFTTIDANNDKSEGGGNVWLFNPNYNLAAWWWDYDTPRTAADDWLITPSINLDNKKVYRLSFDVTGFSTQNNFITNVKATAGKYPTVESQTHTLTNYHREVVRGDNNYTERATVLFRPNKDERRIGFHATNNGNDHIGLDNILIEEYGPATIPAEPTNVTAVKNIDGSVTIKATMPVKRANNMDLSLSEITKIEVQNITAETTVALLEGDKIASQISVNDNAPLFGNNQYRVCAYNSNGCGMEALVEINVIPDTPKNVTNLSIRVLNGGKDAHLTWAYPADYLGANGGTLRPDDLTYTIERSIYTTQGTTSSTVARNIKELEFTDTDVDAAFGNNRQARVTYIVKARTVGGTANGTAISDLLGRAYELPAKESGNSNGLKPWSTANAYMASWNTVSTGYSPMASSQDSEGGLLTFSPSQTNTMGNADYVSPRINLSGMLNPKMTFWIYQGPELKDTYLEIGIVTIDNGVESAYKSVSQQYCTRANVAQNGWYQYRVDLSAYGKCDRASIVLRAMGRVYIQSGKYDGYLHVDNIEITGDKPAVDVRVNTFSGSQAPVMGTETTYTVAVENNGLNEAKDVKVEFFADNELVSERNITLAVDKTEELEFPFTPAIAEEGNIHLTVKLTLEGDLNLGNNELSLNVRTVTPLLSFVNDLKATVEDGNNVVLSWSDPSEYPAGAAKHEDFSSFEDYALNNFGGWTTYDADKITTTNGISGGGFTYTWPHSGEPQAFIVFNPKRVGVSGLFEPSSGDRCLVSFNALGGRNDDWLISPQLSGNKQTINFSAIVITVAPAYEYFETYYSNKSNSVEDFVQVGGVQVVNANIWRPYSFEVPAGAKYFAIRCVTKAESNYQFGLGLDDFEFTPAQPQSRLEGFNIYRDGKLIESDYPENEYTDENVDLNSTVTYQVTAVHREGESIFSNAVSVNYSGIDSAMPAGISIRGVEGAVLIEGAEGLDISLYTVDGRAVYSANATASVRIPVASGLYIVRAGAAAAKVLVK